MVFFANSLGNGVKDMGAVRNFFGEIAWGQNFVTALLAVGGMIVIFHYTDKAPELVYETFPPAQFATQETQISIYNARVENVGDKEAEDVQVYFELSPPSIIQEIKIEPSLASIRYSVTEPDADNIREVIFPILNHGESASFSVLVDKGQAVPLKMEVRGKGVSGSTDRSDDSLFGALSPVLLTFFALFAGIFAIFIGTTSDKFIRALRSQKRIVDTELQIVRTRERTPAKELIDMLVSTTYRLYFNPSVPGIGATKKMRFGAGGEILEGRNKNETTWTIRNDQLELVNSDGNVHSRFYYSANDRRFFHTNDPETMSILRHGIGDQYMVPEADVF